MLSLKDIPVLVMLAGSVVTGGIYVHDMKNDIAEIDKSLRKHTIEQSLGNVSDRLWDTKQRLEKNPNDRSLQKEQQELLDRKERLKIQLQKIEGGGT